MRELAVEEETESFLKRVKKGSENARDGFIANETINMTGSGSTLSCLLIVGKKRDNQLIPEGQTCED
jgi:hypothetical protein